MRADVVIVGSGVAALQVARKLRRDMHVIIITKKNWQSSNSYRAQGGIAAAISPIDQIQSHRKDTLVAGVGRCKEEAVTTIITRGKKEVEALIQHGFAVDRTCTGDVALGLEGAHSTRRIIHSGGDATGQNLCDYLHTTSSVQWLEYTTVRKVLLDDDGGVRGVFVAKHTGETHAIDSPTVILATGGGAGIYQHTTNSATATGDGYFLAQQAGATLVDMEFIQFHPTVLLSNGTTVGLLTEALRGAGAHLVLQDGKRIMHGVHEQSELAPRHVIAETIYSYTKKGTPVYLDCRMIHTIHEEFPTVCSIAHTAGFDPKKDLLPVVPGAHFCIGGIEVNDHGQTSVPGLFAIGEVSYTGLHGANRLASNSLLEGLVQGTNAATYLNTHWQKQAVQFDCAVSSSAISTRSLSQLCRKTLQARMMEQVGVVRNEADMKDLLSHVEGEIQRMTILDVTTCSAEDFEALVIVHSAYYIVKAALTRKETRGAHVHKDYEASSELFRSLDVTFTNHRVHVRGRKNEHAVC